MLIKKQLYVNVILSHDILNSNYDPIDACYTMALMYIYSTFLIKTESAQ